MKTLLAAALILVSGRTALSWQMAPDRVAIVNGESISLKEVEEAAAEDLQSLDLRRAQFERQLSRDRQSMIESALDRVIRGKLLLAEAKKQKISVDELLILQVDGRIRPPTDEAVAEFYNSN